MNITNELAQEGIARELVNRVQNFRKESGFEVTDRIVLFVDSSDKISEAIVSFKDYICQEVLASDLKIQSTSGKVFETDIEGDVVKLTITKS